MFKNCTALSEIDTPKKVNANVNMMLPAAFVNENADQLVRLPVNMSGSVKIKKYNPGTPQIVSMSKCTASLSASQYTYNGSAKKPSVTVTHAWTKETAGSGASVTSTAMTDTLTADKDYSLAYSNNVNAGTATVTVTGKGNYTDSIKKTYSIAKANPVLKFANSTVSKTSIDDPFTNALTKTTDGAVTFASSNTAVAAVDRTSGKVTLSYTGFGTATITATAATGKNYKTGRISFTLKVKKKDIIPVYRLFNTRTGEHFYTASLTERSQYLNAGNWNSEGIAWYAPRKSSEPIYRLSNPNNGNEHHYTKSKSERDWLVGLGWKYNGIAWYSDTDKLVPIYRHYHPIQRTGNHHYTTSKGESNHIVKYEGWKYEGISFYVSKSLVKSGSSSA